MTWMRTDHIQRRSQIISLKEKKSPTCWAHMQTHVPQSTGAFRDQNKWAAEGCGFWHSDVDAWCGGWRRFTAPSPLAPCTMHDAADPLARCGPNKHCNTAPGRPPLKASTFSPVEGHALNSKGSICTSRAIPASFVNIKPHISRDVVFCLIGIAWPLMV